MESKKNDIVEDKLRWDLLPLSLIKEVVKIFHFGAKKYSPNSWQNLENGYDRYKAALFRHLEAYESGEHFDKESGLHHLAHMAWNALAMLYFALKETTKIMRTMMGTVSLYWMLGASAVMIFIAFVCWATKPDRCPKCGEIMKHRRTFANGKTVDYMVCPKCGTTFIDV